MKKLFLAFFMGLATAGYAQQQTVSIGTTETKANAILWLKATNNQGFLLPAVQTRNTFPITSQDERGMMIFDLSDNKVYYWNGTAWIETGTASGAGESDGIIGNEVTAVNTARGGLELTGSGTATDQLTIGLVEGTTEGQILKWDNTNRQWVLGTDNIGNAPSVDNSSIGFNGSSQLEVRNLGISTAKLQDGGVTDLKVAPGISGNKIIPNFGSQPVSTTGSLTVSGSTTFNTRTYSWPSTVAGANTFLRNDGSGNLTWQTIASTVDQTAQTGVLVGNGTAISGITSGGGSRYFRRNAANSAFEFASLTAADIPALDVAKIATGVFPIARGGTGLSSTPTPGQLLIGNGSGFTLSTLSATDIPSLDAAKISTGVFPVARGGTGLSATPTPGQLLIGNGSGFTLSTLSATDIPPLDAAKISTGVFPVARGGTGLSATPTPGQLLIGNGSGFTLSTLSAADIPPLDAAKISTGVFSIERGGTGISATPTPGQLLIGNATGGFTLSTLSAADIPSLDAAKITTGTFPLSRISGAGASARAILGSDNNTVSWVTGAPDQLLGTDASGVLSFTNKSNFMFTNTNVIPKGSASGLASSAMSENGGEVTIYQWVGNGTSRPQLSLSAALGLVVFPNPVPTTTWTLTTYKSDLLDIFGQYLFEDHLAISLNDATVYAAFGQNSFLPGATNTFDLGNLGNNSSGAMRWRNIYLVNNPNVSSDQRLKEDIQNIKYGLNEVMQMRPVSYRFKSDETHDPKLGLIAQEVREIIPDIVKEDNSADKYLSMSYTDLVPVLIKAIQEQQKTIDELSSQLQQQKDVIAQVKNLEQELKAIKELLHMEANTKQKK